MIATKWLLAAVLVSWLGSGPRANAQRLKTLPVVSTVYWMSVPPQGCFESAAPVYASTTGKFASSVAHFVTQEELVFIDAAGVRWVAPAHTITDGVSVPQAWLSVIGAPTDDRYMKAAILHDAYCAADNRGGASYHSRSCADVNRMFYEVLRASGTARSKALLMYACVQLFGPAKWLLASGTSQGSTTDGTAEDATTAATDPPAAPAVP